MPRTQPERADRDGAPTQRANQPGSRAARLQQARLERARARMTPAQRRRADRDAAETARREAESAAAGSAAAKWRTGNVRVARARGGPETARPLDHAQALPLGRDRLEQSRPDGNGTEAQSGTAPSLVGPDPEVTKVRHDRKQHLQPAQNANKTPATVPNDAADDEPRTGVSLPEDVTSVNDVPVEDVPVGATGHAKARRVPASIVRQAPAVQAGATGGPVVQRAPGPVEKVQVQAAADPSLHLVEPPLMPVRDTPSQEPNEMRALYNKHGKLIMPAALKGSHEILVHQNVMADADGLNRIQDDVDLDAMRAGKLLVALPEGPGLRSDDRLPTNRRFCRPWTAMFLKALSQAHYQRFGTPLQVNSAVRTVEFQQRLQRTNGNAAPAEGETASPHLTGQAVDLAKHGLSASEIAWMRGYLLPLVQEGKIDVEEEFQQACFHISVYRKYAPQAAPKRVVTPRVGGSALAAAALR